MKKVTIIIIGLGLYGFSAIAHLADVSAVVVIDDHKEFVGSNVNDLLSTIVKDYSRKNISFDVEVLDSEVRVIQADKAWRIPSLSVKEISGTIQSRGRAPPLMIGNICKQNTYAVITRKAPT